MCSVVVLYWGVFGKLVVSRYFQNVILQEAVSVFATSVAIEQVTLIAEPRSVRYLLLVPATIVAAVTTSFQWKVSLAESFGR